MTRNIESDYDVFIFANLVFENSEYSIILCVGSMFEFILPRVSFSRRASVTLNSINLVEAQMLHRLVERLVVGRDGGGDCNDTAETVRSLRVDLAIQTARAESAERRADAAEADRRAESERRANAERRADAAEHKAEIHVQDAIEIGDKLAGAMVKIAEITARNEDLASRLDAAEHTAQSWIEQAASLQEKYERIEKEYNSVPYPVVPLHESESDRHGHLGISVTPMSNGTYRDSYTLSPPRDGESRRTSPFERGARQNQSRTELKNPDEIDPGDSDDGDDNQPQYARLRPVNPPPLIGRDRADKDVWADWQIVGDPVG